MFIVEEHTATDEVAVLLDRLAAAQPVQSNCMFQLALMVARIATEPCSEAFKEETAQALMGLIRAKPKSNVVRMLGGSRQPGKAGAARQAIA